MVLNENKNYLIPPKENKKPISTQFNDSNSYAMGRSLLQSHKYIIFLF